MTSELAKRSTGRILASDNHGPLIALWEAWLGGWRPTSDEYPTRARYVEAVDRLRAGGVDLEDVLLGFACSYNSTFCGSFAPLTMQNYLNDTCRALEKQCRAFAGRVSFSVIDFLSVQPFDCPGLLIYCAPPYAGTAGYPSGPFNHELFWAACRAWRSNGAEVYVSEFTAPADVPSVWDRHSGSTFNKVGRASARHVEHLFRLA